MANRTSTRLPGPPAAAQVLRHRPTGDRHVPVGPDAAGQVPD